LELLDFDLAGQAFEPWQALVRETAPTLLDRLVIERSPSGGWHVVYRCQSPVSGNQVLTQRIEYTSTADMVTIAGKTYKPRQDAQGRWYVLLTLIETRGEGGLFLCAPSQGYELVQGDFTNLPVLSGEERESLFVAARSLNQYWPSPVNGNESATSGDNLPGRDFNRRGDISELLRKHGWTLARTGSNGNLYWRRPGKSDGWSATLKDRVFYCFSSNADPFEERKAYSPFAVYALLEHSGDYRAAASALRAQGFGEDTPQTVDLSGIIGTDQSLPSPSPAITDPGPMPEELLRVPGFVGDVIDFCLSAARYPNLPLAFCGAMALQSFLASRKVREPGGLRPNLYLLALAASGSGKATPRKINSYILSRAGMGDMVGNQIASGQGLEDEMLVHRKMLFQTDEVDHLLRCVALPKESYYSLLLAMLLQLYTEADEIHVARARARDRNRKPESRGEVDQPGLVIFGTATPDCFFAALSPMLLTNGLFARAIVLDAYERGRRQRPRDMSEIPKQLIETAIWWRDYNPAPVDPATGRQPNLDEEHPTPAVIPYSDEGYSVLDDFAATADEAYNGAMRKGDHVEAILWTRASENATRLVINYAVSRDRFAPVIDREAATWATRFVGHMVRRMLFLASTSVAENEFHGNCLKFLRRLREAGGQMARRELMRLMHWKVADFDQVAAALIAQGYIEAVEVPTRTKPAAGYRLL